MQAHAILLISCQDKKGIVARLTEFIYQNNGNIEHADQHIDSQTKIFFIRIEWSLKDFKIPKEKIAESFTPLAEEFKMDWQLHFTDSIPKVAIFVSKTDHCLYDLILKQKAGHLHCTIPMIISNYPDFRTVSESFGIPFYEFPKKAPNRRDTEEKEKKLLLDAGVDLILLARYDRIFTADFISSFPNRIINIHHSFLPAFIGKNPYEQAYAKGVKLIGATSHFVVEELDAGPIIEQDTVRATHRDSLNDLKRKGEDLERTVLTRATRWYLQRKILVFNNKTVVFD